MIRLVCVDDDPIVLGYLTTRLSIEPDIRVVGSYDSAGTAFAQLSREEVDVVLLDYRLNGADGLRLLETLTIWYEEGPTNHHRPSVLFCTGLVDDEFRERANEMGAAGVVCKTDVTTELVPAVRAVARGERWFN